MKLSTVLSRHWVKQLPSSIKNIFALLVIAVSTMVMASCGASITPMEGGETGRAPRPTTPQPTEPTPTTPTPQQPPTTLPPIIGQEGTSVRIALATATQSAAFSANGAWAIYERNGSDVITRSNTGETWTVTASSGSLRLSSSTGKALGSRSNSLVLRTSDRNALLSYNGKRYRGELLVQTNDSGILVVNKLPMESYLRGVVPLEIGPRQPAESAAVQAQAVAARSYSYLHLGGARPYDMMATVQDQVYGGVDAERPFSDAAVRATRGVVLKYAGRVINTPYHSTCGGKTAAVSEVWHKQRDEPYLKAVSDINPETMRAYCEVSPRYSWTREFTASQLASVLSKYLRSYASVSGDIGIVRNVKETGRTPSGRAYGISISTSRGSYSLRGNDVRFVLRAPNGEILNSTDFKTEAERDGSASDPLTRLVVHGNGYGHGIGMCQWGAIARARAGQDYKTILRTYYPGTTVGSI